MSLASLLNRDVTIVDPGTTTDRHRNVVDDWTTATRTTVKGRLQQTDSVEVTVGRDTIVADSLLFLLPDAPITAQCRVEAAADVFEVVGKPALVDGRVGPHHFEVRLRAVVG